MIDSTLKISYLHGFLGSPQDGSAFLSELQGQLSKSKKVSEAQSIDLYKILKENSVFSWDEFLKILTQSLSASSVLNHFETRVWLGYSMGGRLLLPLVEERPQDIFVFISSHPGLRCEDERKQRLFEDQRRAHEVRHVPDISRWTKWVDNWNKQPVLSPYMEPSQLQVERWEDRKELAQSLDLFSLGRQPDYREVLARSSDRILWVTGSDDVKFSEIGRELSAMNRTLRVCEIPGAAHRIPLTHPLLLAESVARFLNQSRS